LAKYAGLRALKRDETVEKWLRDQVAPVYDAMQADPSLSLDAKSIFDDIRSHHAARLNGPGRRSASSVSARKRGMI
jgi:antitoxin ParD1/3/4